MFKWHWWKNEAGFLQFLPAILSLGSTLLGKAAQGSAQGRQQETQNLATRDALRTSQYQTAQNAQMNKGALDLSRKNFSEDARSGRARQALVGNLLSNVQDIGLNVPGIANSQISGGLRPSALGAGGRESAAELARQAMLAQVTPDHFEGGDILTPPELSPLPKASGWEKAAGIGSLISGLLGGGLSLFQPKAQPLSVSPNVPIVGGIDNLRLPGGVDALPMPELPNSAYVNPQLIRNVRF